MIFFITSFYTIQYKHLNMRIFPLFLLEKEKVYICAIAK